MIGAFCNFHVNSKQRETKQMGFGFKQPLVREKHCVTTLIMAAEETIYVHQFIQLAFHIMDCSACYVDSFNSGNRMVNPTHGEKACKTPDWSAVV